MELNLKIHSLVDVITNSSSVTYIYALNKSIDIIKELINNLLKVGGSDLTADDLFEFGFTKEDDSWHGYSNRFIKVKAKDPENKVTAKILSSLENLFSYQSVMDN